MPLLKVTKKKVDDSPGSCLTHYKELPTRLQELISILWVKELCYKRGASSPYMLAQLLISDDNIGKSHTVFRSIYRHLKRKSEGEKFSRNDPLLKLERLDNQATDLISHPIWRLITSSRCSNAELESMVCCLPRDIQVCVRDFDTGEFKPDIDNLASKTNLDALCAVLLIILILNNEHDYFENSFERSRFFITSNQILLRLVFRLFLSLFPEKGIDLRAFRCLFIFCRYIENTLADVKCKPNGRATIKFRVFNPNCSDKNKHRELFLPSMFVASETAQCLGYPNLINLSYQCLFVLYKETYQLLIQKAKTLHKGDDFALLILSVIDHAELSEIYRSAYATPTIKNQTLESALRKAETLG
ncbi:hypothetical protein [Shewanella pneumatophori]|uniref:Uncharacterized protein n=1 Tax=Shewanella pneumatophori TaxID=314092 RepID=A0A9X2CGR8_9GAMM|nr:hypothetical protein [Shewanella pneumatophori]MCL1137734.1 hypothetical protein [Shewanella pneumatophori]